MGADLYIYSDLKVELALSIFLLAYAIGPFFSVPPPNFTDACCSCSPEISGIFYASQKGLIYPSSISIFYEYRVRRWDEQ
jgi:hypothetical protein